MKFLRSFTLTILFSFPTWGSTHIINQAFFLQSSPEKSWKEKDVVIVLGAETIALKKIIDARKKISKSIQIFWLLSDDQWLFNDTDIDKDKKVLDFINELKKNNIQTLSENACPTPTVLQEKNYNILIIDSNWFLFPHQKELFTQSCSDIDTGQFYEKINESLINAKLKPLVIISNHGIHPRFTIDQGKNSLSRLTNKIQQSIGPMNGNSNPGYQQFQEKMTIMISARENTLFVSGEASKPFQDFFEKTIHIVLQKKKPEHILLKNDSSGLNVLTSKTSKPFFLKPNKIEENFISECKQQNGAIHHFKHNKKIYSYFMGTNHRSLWDLQLSENCFDLEKEKLTITHIEGTEKSPNFFLKDSAENEYILRSLIKDVRLPNSLRGTIVEDVYEDLQSSQHPLGFLLASNLAKQAGILDENPKLVYVDTNQKAFFEWREKKQNFISGFYQFVEKPKNIFKNRTKENNEIVEVVTTKEMVHHLENDSNYHLDQSAYLKARLFDILIGDWDRDREKWEWLIQQDGEIKTIKPFPTDRTSAFYHDDGSISWWRRRKWIDYSLQDYSEKLKHPDSMMLRSLSMDNRFTSGLTKKDWELVVADLKQNLSQTSMEKAIASMPFTMPPKDKEWLIQSFSKRLQDLPTLSEMMRTAIQKNLDIVGTGCKDVFLIQSEENSLIHIEIKNENKTFFSNSFDPKLTKEIRLYGLNNDDQFLFRGDFKSNPKFRLIPGEGADKVDIQTKKNKPNITLYEQNNEKTETSRQFHKKNYKLEYSDYYSQINQRNLNILSPILFLASSNADSGFILGGGLKYYQSGFQKSPWAHTNELKANVVLNRAATNIVYKGTWYDISETSDLETEIEAGIPRFYGSFFGLGNSPASLDKNKSTRYYWLRSKHLESTVKLNIPIAQYVSLIPKLQFRFRDYVIENDSFLNNPAENNLDSKLGTGTNTNIGNANYYIGTGLSLKYLSDDQISGPLKKRVVHAEASWLLQKGLAKEDGSFHTIDANAGLTGYFRQSKTQWKGTLGYGANFGDWEFFDAQFLGGGQNLRGFFMNRFAGSSRFYNSLEINQSLLWKRKKIITDYGVGAFFDNGRVFLKNDSTSNQWHKAVGFQAWITGLNLLAFKFGYALPLAENDKGIWSFTLTSDL